MSCLPVANNVGTFARQPSSSFRPNFIGSGPLTVGCHDFQEKLYHFMVILAAITTAVGIEVVDLGRMPSDTISIDLASVEGYCVPEG
jgi:hypothetical protein